MNMQNSLPKTKSSTERMNVGISKALLERVDEFIQTPMAKRLVIDSRNSFFEKLGIAFLAKVDEEYKTLDELYNLKGRI